MFVIVKYQPSTRPPPTMASSPSSSSSSSQHSPQHTPFVPPGPMPLLAGLLLVSFAVFLDLFTEYHPPFIASLREFLGPELCRAVTYIILIVHSVETIAVACILWRRGESDWTTFAMWLTACFLLGYFSNYRLFERINSKAVKVE
jgi:hypothetical protein